MKLKNGLRCAASILLAALLCGCDEAQLVWAPDGNRMLFAANDGLRVGTNEGALSAPLAQRMERCAWLPDSHRAIVADAKSIRTWLEASAYMTEDQRKEAMNLADYMKQVIVTAGAKALYKDPRLDEMPAWLGQAALLYLRECDEAALKEHLSAEDYKTWRAVEMTVHAVELLTIVPAAEPSKELWHGFGNVTALALAPDAGYVLIVHGDDRKKDLFDLDVLGLGGQSHAVTAAQSIVGDASWCNDSRHVVYVAGDAVPYRPSLGSLSMLQVRGGDGSLLAKPEPAIPLLNLVADSSFHVRCLRDGRLLFVAPQVQLPAVTRDLTAVHNLYVFKPGDRTPRALLAPADLPPMTDVPAMAINNDETYAALACHDNQFLELVNLGTGVVQEYPMSPAVVPSWRSADEVCFAKENDQPLAGGHKADVVLHSVATGKERSISAEWPKAAVEGILVERK